MAVLTNADPHEGMPAVDTRFDVKSGERLWGEIRCGGPCRDDYARINLWGNGRINYKLQQAALDSLHAANKALKFAIEVTGTWRSCDAAQKYYASDPSRYAPPNQGAHMRGLAIDVSMNYSTYKRWRIKRALLARGWHQARSDEPWHYSFGIVV